MIKRQLFTGAEIRPIRIDGTNYTKAAGQGTYVSDIIDTQGYESFAVITLLGAATAGTVVTQTVQDGNAANMSDTQNLINQFGASNATATQQYTSPTRCVIFCRTFMPCRRILHFGKAAIQGSNRSVQRYLTSFRALVYLIFSAASKNMTTISNCW